MCELNWYYKHNYDIAIQFKNNDALIQLTMEPHFLNSLYLKVKVIYFINHLLINTKMYKFQLKKNVSVYTTSLLI